MKPVVYLIRVMAVLLIAGLAGPFVWEKVTGDYFMTVTGISMEPTYHVGDVLVVQKPTGHDLEVLGEPVVVAFTPGDRTTQYVHRIAELTPEGAVLKGDNNDVADPSPVTEDHVMGTPRAALTGTAAKAYHLTQSWLVRGVLAVIVLLALFLPVRRSPRSQDAEAGLNKAADIPSPETVSS